MPHPDHPAYKACVEFYRLREQRAIEAGAAAGVFGSVMSYLGLLVFGPAFRTRNALAVMALSIVVLGVLGAYGLGDGAG
jgi:hypothetical protein